MFADGVSQQVGVMRIGGNNGLCLLRIEITSARFEREALVAFVFFADARAFENLGVGIVVHLSQRHMPLTNVIRRRIT